jgi:phosphoribosyl 1,2-cyclic phosphate phosphodiesterase
VHADHIDGIGDVKPLNGINPISMFSSKQWIDDIRNRFSYIFGAGSHASGSVPKIILKPIDGPFTAGDVQFDIIPVKHGDIVVYGFRFGNTAYLTDCSEIYPQSYDKLRGVEVLILGASKKGKCRSHLNFSRALDEVEKIRPKRAWFTHICHLTSHEQLERYLSEETVKRPLLNGIEVRAGYDGLVIDGISIQSCNPDENSQ